MVGAGGRNFESDLSSEKGFSESSLSLSLGSFNNYDLCIYASACQDGLLLLLLLIDLMHNDVTRLNAREECWS
jgi:hypothetical protein